MKLNGIYSQQQSFLNGRNPFYSNIEIITLYWGLHPNLSKYQAISYPISVETKYVYTSMMIPNIEYSYIWGASLNKITIYVL
jgi:hypothetical protein